jgi:hypothetical protein
VRKADHNVELAGNQVDVYVEIETPDRGQHRIVVEAKDWSKKVGVDVVNRFAIIVDTLRRKGLIEEGVIVSKSGFSTQARKAASQSNIRLVDIHDLEATVAGALSLSRLGGTVAGEHRSVLGLLQLETIEEFEKERQALGLSREMVSSVLSQVVSSKEQDHQIKAIAAFWIGEGRYYLPSVLAEAMLKDAHWRVRAACAHALGMLESSLTCDSLETVINNEDEHLSVRIEAAKALGSIGDIASLDALRKALLGCHAKMEAIQSEASRVGILDESDKLLEDHYGSCRLRGEIAISTEPWYHVGAQCDLTSVALECIP